MSLKGYLFPAMLAVAVGVNAQTKVSDLAAVYITTPNGEEITSTDVYVPTQMTIVDVDGTITDYPDTKLRGRGSAKFALTKKPYKLKLASKARLLGPDGANGKKWNLMAQHGDKTLLRNAVASFIALEAGQPFAPGARFVDLVMNGTYCGTYQLTDQVDIRKRRVNITEQPEVLAAGANISGGYLLEIDDAADELEGSVFTTARGVKVTIKSPDEDVIIPEQISYISAHVQKFEDALFAENWLDANNGYKRYLDMNSLVQWYITNEFAAEPNAFRSVYFYKDIDNEKLTFGPVWDFDFAFDNSARWGSRPRALVAQEGRGDEWCYTWINRLRQDPAFHEAVNSAWKQLIANDIVNKVIGYIDDTAAQIDKSQQMNFKIYPINEKAHDEQHLFNSYAEGVQFLKQYVTARAEFLTDAFATLAAGGTVPVQGDGTPQDAIEEIENNSNYYVTVRNGMLKFSSVETLAGTYIVYNVAGMPVAVGNVAPAIDLGNLASGTYILKWTIGSSAPHSAKFIL